jgi:hypothetical protein
MIYEQSDGVIPVATQTKWTPPGSNIYTVEVNHNEILQAPETIICIERALRE